MELKVDIRVSNQTARLFRGNYQFFVFLCLLSFAFSFLFLLFWEFAPHELLFVVFLKEARGLVGKSCFDVTAGAAMPAGYFAFVCSFVRSVCCVFG